MEQTPKKEQIERLRQKILYHNEKYYNDDSPEISDFEYDSLLRELEDLEEKYPEFLTKDSPTQKVGGAVGPSFQTVIHEVPMESLHDAFSEDEIYKFEEKIRTIIPDVEFVVEPKIDGLSVSVEYVKGVLKRASTRGDGQVGEDITENLRTIKSMPLKIADAPEFLEVRGEVYMSDESFLNVVKQQELAGEKVFKNPRNAAAGSLRQKKSKIAAQRNLDIFIFNVQQIRGKELNTHTESLDYLKSLGFPVSPSYPCFGDVEKIIDEIKRIGNHRGSFLFQTDGAVVKVNSFKHRKLLGSTSKFPRWAEAFKYPPEQKQTQILNVEINVGRTGILTPIAVLDPVLVAGTTVSRATLHNQDFINQKGICVGDTVTIRKAGEIIPEVLKVEQHAPDAICFQMPKQCPSCGEPVVKEADLSAIRCENIECPAQSLRHLIHFVSRDAMDIQGLGPSVLERLVLEEVIASPVDLYSLDLDKIANTPGLGKKSAQNLIEAVEKSKTAGLSRFLFALGIRHIGKTASKILGAHFGSIEKILEADSIEQFSLIDGFGETMSESLFEYFSLEKSKQLIKKFSDCGVVLTEKTEKTSNQLSGQTFVLTGTLQNHTRDEMKKIIENLDGKVTNSVSKKTSYLIAGENSGSKLKKAESLGINVITEGQFFSQVLGDRSSL